MNNGWPPIADGATIALGGPPSKVPQLLAPTLRGRGGARAVFTPIDEPGKVKLRLGVTAYEHAPPESILEGTSLELPVGPGFAYASVETRHWGPAWAGSLILDAAAAPIPAVGWRKTTAEPPSHRWLSWLGPWNADIFIGRLGGHTEPAHPTFIGMRVQVRPLQGLEIGASRAIQWAGKGRDHSVRSLFKALVGSDNVDDGNTQTEPGNQLAGLDIRYTRTSNSTEWAVYGQAIGEDEAGGLPSQLMVQLGTEWAKRWRGTSARFFAEGSDVIAGNLFGSDVPHPGSAYRHHIYQQGYTHRGTPLGHPVGGDVRLASLGALIDKGNVSLLLSAHRGRAHLGSQRFEPGALLVGFNGAAALDVPGAGRFGLALWRWRAGADRSLAAQAWWHTAWR